MLVNGVIPKQGKWHLARRNWQLLESIKYETDKKSHSQAFLDFQILDLNSFVSLFWELISEVWICFVYFVQ